MSARVSIISSERSIWMNSLAGRPPIVFWPLRSMHVDATFGTPMELIANIASIGTGAPDRDRELPKPDWFDLARFPQAVFEAHGFTAEGAGAWLATGTLTIRDHAVPVALPFTLTIGGDGATMDGKVELDRTSFGIGQGDWAKSDIVGKAVTVIVHIVAKRG